MAGNKETHEKFKKGIKFLDWDVLSFFKLLNFLPKQSEYTNLRRR